MAGPTALENTSTEVSPANAVPGRSEKVGGKDPSRPMSGVKSEMFSPTGGSAFDSLIQQLNENPDDFQVLISLPTETLSALMSQVGRLSPNVQRGIANGLNNGDFGTDVERLKPILEAISDFTDAAAQASLGDYVVTALLSLTMIRKSTRELMPLAHFLLTHLPVFTDSDAQFNLSSALIQVGNLDVAAKALVHLPTFTDDAARRSLNVFVMNCYENKAIPRALFF